MYINRRRAQPHVSDDSVMQDAMMEMRNLHVSVLRVDASRMRLSRSDGSIYMKFLCVQGTNNCCFPEEYGLRISVLRVGASRMRLSHSDGSIYKKFLCVQGTDNGCFPEEYGCASICCSYT
jgi:hypothetical protein